MIMRYPSPLMLSYIHRRVAQRAAAIGYQVEWELELSKSKELVDIETRDRTEKRRAVKTDRWVL